MKTAWWKALALAAPLGGLVFDGATLAATIDLANYHGGNGANLPVVTVSGQLFADDVDEFAHVIDLVGDTAAVELDSPGGDLEAGIAIGRMIRQKQFVTVVNGTCASACALAWLAGRLRFAAPAAQIGFHVAYVGGAVKTESGMGNALVGLYVGELGLGENVVRYVTSAAPDGMQWLSGRDATLLGLDVRNMDGPGTAAVAAMPVTAYAPVEPEPKIQPPPFADVTPGLNQANVNRAVTNAAKRYAEAGMAGLAESSAACWQVVRERRTLDKVQYCRALDVFGSALRDTTGKREPKAALAYFENERRVNDAVDGMVAAGVRDGDMAAKLDGIWLTQLQSAMGLIAAR